MEVYFRQEDPAEDYTLRSCRGRQLFGIDSKLLKGKRLSRGDWYVDQCSFPSTSSCSSVQLGR
ncbi:hypothetical protein KIN20_008260 [Parelaphostrongylus tenuis]|uniref:Uncharacterized protein n=1 Tax=Parelaphostrongylus tenuis TaxID=148309 RepID=A0AAD5MML0_PARTN|nr:hypothetical protein KIN20_008260 [Parelaphostrongylus tenuis]